MGVGINTETGVFVLAEGTQGQMHTRRAAMMVQPPGPAPSTGSEENSEPGLSPTLQEGTKLTQ